MNDQDVVNYVMSQHYGYWDVDEEGNKLDYSPQQTTFWKMALSVTMNVLVFQDWKRHLDNALEVVKTWKPE